jgi:hypothetical protein
MGEPSESSSERTVPLGRRPLQRVAWAALGVVVLGFDLIATGWFGFDERIVAMCRNIVVPGLGFIETDWWLTVVFVAATIVAVTAWLRWGTDWIVGLVWASAIAIAFAVVPAAHTHDAAVLAGKLQVQRASHEFAAVLVLVAMLSRARLALIGLPGVRQFTGRRRDEPADRRAALLAASPIQRCRAVAIAGLTRHLPRPGDEDAAAAVAEPDVRRRAARVAAAARWRLGGDPLRHDNAHIHAALALSGHATADELASFRATARTSPYGVPASEPTWIRLLDGTLAALALEEAGAAASANRWRATLDGDLRLRHGRRPRAIHAPTALRLATAPHWEHATATALARWRGWIVVDDDWSVLRRRSLGAAARGATHPDDARLVAAARIWARLVDDDAASRILDRPSRSSDPIAAALDDVLDTIGTAATCDDHGRSLDQPHTKGADR